MSVLNTDLSLNVEKTIEHAEKLIDQGCHGTCNIWKHWSISTNTYF